MIENETHDYIEGQSSSSSVTGSLDDTTTRNEAYGKFEDTAFTNDVLPSNVKDLPTSQNVAYGDIPTSTTTNDEPDYYVNEGINDSCSSMIENETYDDIEGQNSSSRVTGSLDDTNTRNEAHSSVSTNTEGVDTEETDDYVRIL